MSKNELRVTIDGLSEAIQGILKEYIDEEVKPIVDEEMEKAAMMAKSELKANSPDSGMARKKKYKNSWSHKTVRGRLENKIIIYNKQGQLTHLLENGHFKFNQYGGPYSKDGSRRTRAIPHIKPAQENAEKKLLNGIIERLDNK